MPRRVAEPLEEIEAGGPHQRHGVAVEEVGHADEVAGGGELVGEQLEVDEFVAEDVG